MADYISRQKAIEAIYDLPNCPNGYSDTYDKECIIGMLEEVQTADVVERKDLDTITEAHEQIGYEKGYRDGYAQATVEVVRRKECIHYWKNWKDGEPDCGDDVAVCLGSPRDDAFCSEGERRDDDAET